MEQQSVYIAGAPGPQVLSFAYDELPANMVQLFAPMIARLHKLQFLQTDPFQLSINVYHDADFCLSVRYSQYYSQLYSHTRTRKVRVPLL